MSADDQKGNVYFAPVCGGYLRVGDAQPETVRGCRANVAGVGLWLIEPFDRSITTYDQMVVLYSVAPSPGDIVGATELVSPFMSTSGLSAPDFYVGSVVDDGEGVPEAFAATLSFEVKRIPRIT